MDRSVEVGPAMRWAPAYRRAWPDRCVAWRPLCRRLGELRDRTAPSREELVGIEDVVGGERRELILALHDRDARLATYGAGEPHDDRLLFRGDPAHGAVRQTSAAGRAVHAPDPFEDGSDPVHERRRCTSDATPPARSVVCRACGRTRYGDGSWGNAATSAPSAARATLTALGDRRCSAR